MSKIKVICTDLDGILNNLEKFNEWMIWNYFTLKGEPVPEKKNPHAYDVRDIYELSKTQRDIIWLKNYKYYCLKFGPRSHAFEVLRYWQESGKKVDVTTARAFVTNIFLGNMARNWAEMWFQQNNFKPNEIVWCSEKNTPIEKVKAYKLLHADFGLEDKPDVLDSLLDVCDMAAINTDHNELYVPNRKLYTLYRHDDFLQIKDTVDILDGKGRLI